jgi:hypothetical protein
MEQNQNLIHPLETEAISVPVKKAIVVFATVLVIGAVIGFIGAQIKKRSF